MNEQPGVTHYHPRTVAMGDGDETTCARSGSDSPRPPPHPTASPAGGPAHRVRRTVRHPVSGTRQEHRVGHTASGTLRPAPFVTHTALDTLRTSPGPCVSLRSLSNRRIDKRGREVLKTKSTEPDGPAPCRTERSRADQAYRAEPRHTRRAESRWAVPMQTGRGDRLTQTNRRKPTEADQPAQTSRSKPGQPLTGPTPTGPTPTGPTLTRPTLTGRRRARPGRMTPTLMSIHFRVLDMRHTPTPHLPERARRSSHAIVSPRGERMRASQQRRRNRAVDDQSAEQDGAATISPTRERRREVHVGTTLDSPCGQIGAVW